MNRDIIELHDLCLDFSIYSTINMNVISSASPLIHISYLAYLQLVYIYIIYILYLSHTLYIYIYIYLRI